MTAKIKSWQNLQEPKELDAWVEKQPQANFLNSSLWEKVRKEQGRTVFSRVLKNSQKQIIGAYQADLIVAKRARYLEIEHGPLLEKEIDWASFVADVGRIGRQTKATFIRLRPPWLKNEKNLKKLATAGFKKAPMHLGAERVGLLDLSLNLEKLKANMSQSLRRKLRKLEKLNLTVSCHQFGAKIMAEFNQIHREHAKRQDYVPFLAKDLEKEFSIFSQKNQALVYKVADQDQTLALNMVLFFGQEASYHYGVSAAANLKISAAPLLHLAAIAEAKKRKLAFYNFWGIVDQKAKNHRFFGVSQFKRSFGVIDQEHCPTHDLVLKPISYLPNFVFETIRRQRRRL